MRLSRAPRLRATVCLVGYRKGGRCMGDRLWCLPAAQWLPVAAALHRAAAVLRAASDAGPVPPRGPSPEGRRCPPGFPSRPSHTGCRHGRRLSGQDASGAMGSNVITRCRVAASMAAKVADVTLAHSPGSIS